MFEYRSLKKWKYQLTDSYSYITDLNIANDITTEYVSLKSDGALALNKHYAWDGATGAVDSNNILRASLVHDGLCQLIKEGHLPFDYRKASDKIFKRICIEDGMSKFRAHYTYLAIRTFVKFKYGK